MTEGNQSIIQRWRPHEGHHFTKPYPGKNEETPADSSRRKVSGAWYHGSQPRALPENWDDVFGRWKAGTITGAAAARELEWPKTTFLKRAKKILSAAEVG